MRRRFVMVWGAVCCLSAATVSAQAIDPPTGPDGGLFARRRAADPDQTTHEMELTLNLGSGFDENNQEVRVPVPGFVPELTGVVSSVGGLMRYAFGRPVRSIETSVRGYASRATVGIEQVTGASGLVRAHSEIGERSGVEGSLGGAYEPSFLFNAFGPILEDVDGGVVPGASPQQGLDEERWINVDMTARGYHNWTPGNRSNVRLGTSQRQPTSGTGLDSQFQSFAATHDWDANRNVRLMGGYRRTHRDQQSVGGLEQPLDSQALEGTIRLERRLSATRSLDFTFGGGATRAKTLAFDTREPYVFVVPTYQGATRLDLSRWWSLSADARRDVTVLEGLAPEPFTTDAVSIGLAGTMARRVQVSLSGAYSRGLSELSTTGAFSTKVAMAQMQIALSRCCALFTGYSFYNHRLEDVRTIQAGFPPIYERHSVRVGLTVWMPVFGRF